MRRSGVFILALAISAPAAHAGDTASGSGALALAALVGLHTPNISAGDKHVLSRILEGDLGFAENGQVKVEAKSVSCRSSDVDIAAHDCTLKFAVATQTLKGREAHELYATLVENGVGGDGAAGSIFEAVSGLSCTIALAEVKQRGGGGADCTYTLGPGS